MFVLSSCISVAQNSAHRFNELQVSGLFINTNGGLEDDLDMNLNWFGIGLGVNSGYEYRCFSYWLNFNAEVGAVKEKRQQSAQMFNPNLSINIGYDIISDQSCKLRLHLGFGFNYSILLVGQKIEHDNVDISYAKSTSYALTQLGCYIPLGIKLFSNSVYTDISYRLPLHHFKQTPFGSDGAEVSNLSDQNLFPLCITLGYRF